MTRASIIAAMLLASMGNAGAQSNRGPAFPTEAQRGAGISKRRLVLGKKPD
jgi:hypothetical protein